MMMLYRLVRLIETHSQALAASVLEQVRNSKLTQNFQQKVPPEDLNERVYEVYRHLGEWLMGKDELQLEQRYLQIGARRASQQVPMSEVIWVIVLTKDSANWKCCSCWSSFLTGQFTMPRSVTNRRSRTRRSGKLARHRRKYK